MSFLLDTGATTTLLPEKYVDISKQSLATRKTLQMYNGSIIISLGSANIWLYNPTMKTKYVVKFDIVKEDLKPILGIEEVIKLKLINIDIDNFESVMVMSTPVYQKRGDIEKI